MLNSLLHRQIQKKIGDPDQMPEKFMELFRTISESYDHYEKDLTLLKRSLDLSSDEMIAVHNKLRNESVELTKAHREMRTLFENIEEVFFSVDMESHSLLQISPACERVYGFPAEAFQKNENLWYEVILEEDKKFIDTDYQAIHAGKLIILEYRIRHKNNSIHWVETKVTPTLNEEGKLIRIDGVTADISEKKQAAAELRESEEQIQTIFNAVLDAVIIMDEEGKIVKWDTKAEALFGWKENEVTGKLLSEAISPPALREAHTKDLEYFLKTGAGSLVCKTVEVTAINKKKMLLDISLSISPSLVKNKYQFIGFLRDITSRKKGETAIRQSEKHFRSLIENNEDAICLIDAQANISYQSPSVERMMGFTFEERKDKKGPDLIHPDDLAESDRMLSEVLRNPFVPFPFQHRKRHKDGHYLWVEGTLTNRFEDDSVRAIIANYRDITKRKEAEEEIKTSEAHLRASQQIAHVGSWEMKLNSLDPVVLEQNPNINTLIWSDETYHIFDLDPAEIKIDIEYFFRYCIYPEDRMPIQNAIFIAITTATEYYIEHQISVRNGMIRSIEERAYVVYDPDTGTPLKIIGTSQDITERKKIESELAAQNRELLKTNTELDKFVYSVSHDLRAPLTTMLGLVDYSREITDKEHMLECLGMLTESIKKLDGFILDILHYSRNSRIELVKEEINFREMLKDFMILPKFLNPDAPDVKIKLEIDDAIPFYSDKYRVGVVLNNLVSNAIRYKNHDAETHTIHINVNISDLGARVIIKDNGIGISKEHHQRIFDMFFRVSEDSVGSGLGLYIVKEAIDKLKGNIEIESEVGKGTTFRVYIPHFHSTN